MAIVAAAGAKGGDGGDFKRVDKRLVSRRSEHNGKIFANEY